MAVLRAAELLRAGEVVALPTETVYGLAANALDPAAVARIYEIKGRPAHNPIIVHVSDLLMARQCVNEWPEIADRFAAAFWPGPLTMVLCRSPRIPEIVAGGGPTVGVRWPSHPFIQAVIRECQFPIAAPSANPSNQLSPTNADHVRQALGTEIALIVDGGQSQVGIESTVLDVSVAPPRVLRPGMIHAESLAAVTALAGRGIDPDGLLKSPGMLEKHYAPRAKLMILSWRNDTELLKELTKRADDLSSVHVITHTHIPSSSQLGGVSVIPHDAEAFARALYAELHRCDESGARVIVVEQVPNTPAWIGIADRLRRAAS